MMGISSSLRSVEVEVQSTEDQLWGSEGVLPRKFFEKRKCHLVNFNYIQCLQD